MQEYILVNSVDGVKEYGIITISRYLTHDVDDVEVIYDICYTDNPLDATRFTCIGSAFEVIHKVCKSPTEWDVLPLEEK